MKVNEQIKKIKEKLFTREVILYVVFGILTTIININPLNKELLIKPNITTRGFVLVNENAELIYKIEEKVTEIVNKVLKTNYTYVDLKNQIILELSPFINELTGRRPIILPVIMEVKENTH